MYMLTKLHLIRYSGLNVLLPESFNFFVPNINKVNNTNILIKNE